MKRRWVLGTVWAMGLCAVIGTLGLMLSCGVIPPPYVSRPSVLVEYHLPDLLPDKSGYLFIKSVTQQRSVKRYHTVVLPGVWNDEEEAIWTKAFLCCADSDGSHKRCMMEVPSDSLELTPANDRRVFRISGFKVSASQKSAVVLTPFGHLAVIDLEAHACHRYEVRSALGLTPQEGTLDISPEGSEFVVASKGRYRGVAICKFDGEIRLFPTEEYPYSVNWNKGDGLLLIRFVSLSFRYFVVIDPQSMKTLVDSRTTDPALIKKEYPWVFNTRPCWLADGIYIGQKFATMREGTGYIILPGEEVFAGKRISRQQAASVW